MANYDKPELTTLGDAAKVIQGTKVGQLDAQHPDIELGSDCTCDE